ncbi:hypothetical protein [Methylobacterium sp. Gmos1]
MMRAVVVLGCAMLLGGCVSGRDRAAISAAEAGVADCKARTFRTAVERARCLNAAAEAAAPAAGSSGDLFRVAQNTRLVLAEQVDRKEITQAEADLKMSQTMAGLVSEDERRANARRALRIQASQSRPDFQIVAPGSNRIDCTSRGEFGQVRTVCN